MKILITTDPEIPVPPEKYGGAERIAFWLIQGFLTLGFEVVVIANRNSTLEKVSFHPWPRDFSRGIANSVLNALKLRNVLILEKPDIIYCFSRIAYLYPSLFMAKRPKFIKRYGRFISPKSTGMANIIFNKRIHYIALANHMISHLSQKEKYSIIPNCVDTDFFVDDNKLNKEYLLFLGRIEHIKGTLESIQIAIASSTPLIIAGNIPDDQTTYFEEKIEPFLDHPLIKYVGPVNDFDKRTYIQGALALLFPINLKVEAFGIVTIESLACGTPVIGRNIAAVPEIIRDGFNGYVCSTNEEMVSKVQDIKQLDRDKIRLDAIERFSIGKVVEKHVELFNQLLKINER